MKLSHSDSRNPMAGLQQAQIKSYTYLWNNFCDLFGPWSLPSPGQHRLRVWVISLLKSQFLKKKKKSVLTVNRKRNEVDQDRNKQISFPWSFLYNREIITDSAALIMKHMHKFTFQKFSPNIRNPIWQHLKLLRV